MITNRQEKLLSILVNNYIKTAEPVSSKALVKSRFFNLSSATLRNEMHELEESGYLVQLHTSGGRVPTDKAYRYFVNQLLDKKPAEFKPSKKDIKKISQVLSEAGNDPRSMNKAVASVLSECTGNLVITGIGRDTEFFKQGLVKLFKMPEFRESDVLFQLAGFFEGFDLMYQLIEREFIHTLGIPSGLPIHILIGQENPFKQIRGETIMCAKYVLPGDIIGSLTLIGPTRMDYENNIALIDHTIKQLSRFYSSEA